MIDKIVKVQGSDVILIKRYRTGLGDYDDPEYEEDRICIKGYLSSPSSTERQVIAGRFGEFDIRITVAGYVDISENRDGIPDRIILNYDGQERLCKVTATSYNIHPLSRQGKKHAYLKILPGREVDE